MAALVSSADELTELSDVVKSKPAVLEISENMEQEDDSCANGSVPALELEPATMEDSELETSTTALMRPETVERERNGRPASFHLLSRTDSPLTDTFRVGGKSCVVNLEEDHITWMPKKAEGKREGEWGVG